MDTYFAGLAGFFIIEDTIMKSGNGDGLMTRPELEALWELCVQKVQSVLRDQFGRQSEVRPFLEVKQHTSVFTRAVAEAGLPEKPMVDFIVAER